MKINVKSLLLIVSLSGLLCACNTNPNQQKEELLIYAGSASRPATEEIAKLFSQQTGIETNIVFGGSGYVLSQMKLSKKGDIYFPGSSDFMDLAVEQKMVLPQTIEKIVYLVNCISVQKGNPKEITELHDLLKQGMRLALANPEGVCLGYYAIEIVENSFDAEERKLFKNNLVNYTVSCEKTASAISLKTVDAIIGWHIFEHWNPEQIESVRLHPTQIQRIAYIPAAVSVFSENQDGAKQFIAFLSSTSAQEIFEKYHYFTQVEQALDYIGEEKPVGGHYDVPDYWF